MLELSLQPLVSDIESFNLVLHCQAPSRGEECSRSRDRQRLELCAVQIDEPLSPASGWPQSALYYAGAITHDRQTPGTFRVANSVALSMIHTLTNFSMLGTTLSSLARAVRSWNADSERNLFADLLSEIFGDQTMRSLSTPHEPDLRGILKLVVLPPPDIACRADARRRRGPPRTAVRGVVADPQRDGDGTGAQLRRD
ncbi:hypothetical protein DFH09DRAFT_1155783 [Mycena vulgaris]|nr:hypothetical protein DFH09DRAFT_1155783 [Mycena vulgaris]